MGNIVGRQFSSTGGEWHTGFYVNVTPLHTNTVFAHWLNALGGAIRHIEWRGRAGRSCTLVDLEEIRKVLVLVYVRDVVVDTPVST